MQFQKELAKSEPNLKLGKRLNMYSSTYPLIRKNRKIPADREKSCNFDDQCVISKHRIKRALSFSFSAIIAEALSEGESTAAQLELARPESKTTDNGDDVNE